MEESSLPVHRFRFVDPANTMENNLMDGALYIGSVEPVVWPLSADGVISMAMPDRIAFSTGIIKIIHGVTFQNNPNRFVKAAWVEGYLNRLVSTMSEAMRQWYACLLRLSAEQAAAGSGYAHSLSLLTPYRPVFATAVDWSGNAMAWKGGEGKPTVRISIFDTYRVVDLCPSLPLYGEPEDLYEALKKEIREITGC